MKYISIAIIVLILQIGSIVGLPIVMSKFISKADNNVVNNTIESILINDFGVLLRAKIVNPKYESEYRLESSAWKMLLTEKPKSFLLKSRVRAGKQKNFKDSVYILNMSKNTKIELSILTEISSGEEIIEKINVSKHLPITAQWKAIVIDYITNVSIVSFLAFLWGLWADRKSKK